MTGVQFATHYGPTALGLLEQNEDAKRILRTFPNSHIVAMAAFRTAWTAKCPSSSFGELAIRPRPCSQHFRNSLTGLLPLGMQHSASALSQIDCQSRYRGWMQHLASALSQIEYQSQHRGWMQHLASALSQIEYQSAQGMDAALGLGVVANGESDSQ